MINKLHLVVANIELSDDLASLVHYCYSGAGLCCNIKTAEQAIACGFVAYREFQDGLIAGIVPMTFGNHRIVLCSVDWSFGYIDGW